MSGSAQPDPSLPDEKPVAEGHDLEDRELQAALQLLVERAQFITGATGVALALPHGEEMVCRASAGSCAPPVGASLQVRSGLSGESVARRQLLRCDNAENDPRVNLETCRALGIASIVVMPLVGPKGEVRGLFELFSDHAYAFEERDLSALERMAALTLTALDLAEDRPEDVSAPVLSSEPPVTAGLPAKEVSPVEQPVPSAPVGQDQAPASGSVEVPPAAADAAPMPEAMRNVQRCTSCGFPVSEGRALCLDCERKQGSPTRPAKLVPAEVVPPFLDSSPPPQPSWLADHVNLLAIVVLLVGILVAVVVFR